MFGSKDIYKIHIMHTYMHPVHYLSSIIQSSVEVFTKKSDKFNGKKKTLDEFCRTCGSRFLQVWVHCPATVLSLGEILVSSLSYIPCRQD